MTRHDSEYINISHVGSEYINITFFLLLSPHHYVRVDKTNESIYKHIAVSPYRAYHVVND